MSISSETPPTAPGSSSHARFPFVTGGPPADRQATVLSGPRTEGSSATAPPPSGSVAALESNVAPSPASMRLFPGQRIDETEDAVAGQALGHFLIRRRIGAGGMGTVFLADDEKLQRQVALKVLAPQQTADPASVQRFLNEARAAARLDHDHIARVFFYGDDQGLHYIAYEYVQGGNLRELIRARGRLEPAEVVAYAVQLAAALCHTSSCGVVHRDIKPSNIIVTQQGKAKLVDLGLARKESLEESAQLTVAGTTLGTFDYISPEQAKDPRNVDVRSDIYSLGCTMYHALTGEPPFPEGTVLQRLLDHQDKEPPDPAARNRRVSPALSAVVRKMMAPDPRRRYPSAEALLHDLMLIAGAMGLRTLPDDQTGFSQLLAGRPSGWWSQNASWLMVAAGLVLVAGVWQAYPEFFAGGANAETANSPAAPSARPLPPQTPMGEDLADRTGDNSVHPAEPRPPTAVLVRPADGVRSAPATTAMAASPIDPTDGILTNSQEGWPGSNAATTGASNSITSNNAGNESSPSDSSSSPTRLDVPTSPSVGTGRDAAIGESARPIASGVDGPRMVTSSPAVAATLQDGGRTGVPMPNTTESADTAPGTGASAANATLPAATAGPFVVAGSAQSFASLDAACAEIRDQGVIELHFDGPRAESERPLRLVGKRITIQAAKGRRPVLRFAPSKPVTDPLQSRMITVSGGSLSLVKVSIELQIRQAGGADLWALFRLERPERLRLEEAFVSIVNPTNALATVIESAAPPAATVKMGAMPDGQPVVTTEVLIEKSVVRGETNGIRLRDNAPMTCDFRETFFAISEWLLQTAVAADVMSPTTDLNLSLTDNTCLLGQGLLKAVGEDDLSGRVSRYRIAARSCLFSCGLGVPFIEQQFVQRSTEFRKALQWSGDRNQFDAIEIMWLTRFNSPPDEPLDFEGWRNFWNSGDVSGRHNQPVSWMREWRQQEWSKISPQAVRANLPAEAIVTGSTAEPTDAGANWELLPSEPTAAPPRAQ